MDDRAKLLESESPVKRPRRESTDEIKQESELLFDVTDSLRLQLLQLAPHPELAEKTMRQAFQVIARARYNGCWAGQLAVDLGIKPRDLFYQIEGLRLAGLVIPVQMSHKNRFLKETDMSPQSLPGNVLFHVRFYDTEKIEAAQMRSIFERASDPLEAKIMSALESSSSKVAFEADLRALANNLVEEHGALQGLNRRMAGRLYQRVRLRLHQSQRVECVRVWDPSGRCIRDALCLHGVHPESPNPSLECAPVPQPPAPLALDDADPSPCQSIPDWGSLVIAERPLIVQAMDLLDVSSVVGTTGITSPEFAELLGLRRKTVERLVSELVKYCDVTKVLESDGKMHVNRYFSRLAKLPTPDMDTASTTVTPFTPTSRSRLDVTFQRRVQRALALVQERGTITPLDLRKSCYLDGSVGSSHVMDRRSAIRVFEELAKAGSVAVVRRSDTIPQFAYWTAALSEAEARERISADDRQKHLERWSNGSTVKKRRSSALQASPARDRGEKKLVDGLREVAAALPSTLDRRVLEGIDAHSLRSTGEVCGGSRDQKIVTYYGFQAPVMVRVKLLHKVMLTNMGVEDGVFWSANSIVDSMEVSAFLQIIGLGVQMDHIDQLLRDKGGDLPRVRELPPKIRNQLLSKTYTGRLRAPLAVRRLLAHLVKLSLAKTRLAQTEEAFPGVTVVDYGLCRAVALNSRSYDFADVTAHTAYWQALEKVSLARISESGVKKEDSESDPETRKRTCRLRELFSKKNWSNKAWLTPSDRVAIETFDRKLRLPHGTKCEPQGEVRPRILTPKSLEIVALSERINVAPERIVKHCIQQVAIDGNLGVQPHATYSLLSSVRFRCHLCKHICFQRTTIAEHYQRAHSAELPEDESVFCEPEFYAQRLEQARPDAAGRRNRVKLSKSSSDSDGITEAVPMPPAEEPDDTVWLQLLLISEQLASYHDGPIPLLSRASIVGGVCPLLARLTGLPTSLCVSSMRRLVKARKSNMRTVSSLRTEAVRAVMGSVASETVATYRALGRAVAKSILLTPLQAEDVWWRKDWLSREVHEIVECAYHQWRGEGLVSKVKPSASVEKLPEGCRPRYVLTWQARLRMFGRGVELARWHEVHNRCRELSMKTLPLGESEATGALVHAVADHLIHDTVALVPVWDEGTCKEGKTEDHEASSDCPQCRETHHLERTPTHYTYGGVKSHLEKTANTRRLKCLAVTAEAVASLPSRLRQWVSVSDAEVKALVTQDNEPIDPLRGVHVAEEPDSVARSWICDSPSDSHSEELFWDYVRHATLPHTEELLDSTVFLLRRVLEAPEVRKCRSHSESTSVRSCSVSSLRHSFTERWKSEDLFGSSLACLEELRLLLPFSCGRELHEAPASSIAPFCVRVRVSTSGVARDLGLFCHAHAGRHWSCDPLPDGVSEQKLLDAAGVVARLANPSLGKAAVHSMVLPRGLVAPAAWVQGNGALNMSLLRFMSIKLLHLISKTPGSSAAELARQMGLIDESEIDLVLGTLSRMDAFHYPQHAHARGKTFHVRTWHHLADMGET